MTLIQTILQTLRSNPSLSEELQRLYNEHKGRAKVSDRLNVSYNTVGHIAREMGWQPTRCERRSIKKYFGSIRDPFDGSDFGDYLIGYILGDGSLEVSNGRVYGVCISSSDLEHLETIRDMWDPSLTIKGPYKNNYVLHCPDEAIATRLLEMGFVPAKSKVGMHLSIPVTLPMLRGLFDSDGTVIEVNNGIGLRVSVLGTRSYLEMFAKLFEFAPRWEDYPTYSVMTYGKFEYVKTFRDSIYKDATVFLKRKHERFYKPVKYTVN